MIAIKDVYDVVDLYQLGEFAGGQYKEIKDIPNATTRWEWYYKRQRALGRPDDETGRAQPLAASCNDIVAGTSPNGVNAANISHANIYIAHGQYAATTTTEWAYGRFLGHGAGNVYPNSLVPRGIGGTEIVMYPDKWVTDPNCKVNLPELGTQDNLVMAAFRSVTYNAEGTVGAYHEFAGIDQIHVTGQAGRGFKKGRLVVAFFGWDFGSASEMGNVYGNDLDSIWLLTRGTPGQFRKTTGMGGNQAMFLMLGTCDAPYDFGNIECDDFPAVWMTRAQWGRESGGRFGWNVLKLETGITNETRNLYTGTIIGDLKGRHIVNGGIVNHAESAVNVESLVVLDDKDGAGIQQPNLVQYKLGRWNTEANFLHEVNGNVYGNPSGFPYDGQDFFYKNLAGNRKVQVDRTDLAPLVGVKGHKSRLGFQRFVNGVWTPAFSHANGTPAFSYGGTAVAPPVSNPPVINSFTATPATSTVGSNVTLAWQTTNAITVSIAGLSTIPVDGSIVVRPAIGTTYILTATNAAGATATATVRVSIPVSTSPVFASTFSGTGPNILATVGSSIAPAISWSNASFANDMLKTVNGNPCYPWANGRASKVVYLGITVAGPFNYQRLTAEHKIAPDGKVLHGETFTGITLQVGVKVARLELPCSENGTLTTVLGGALNSGSTAVMTIEAMEIYA